MALFLSGLVLTPLNKMVMQNENIVTFLMSSTPFSFLPLSERFWGEAALITVYTINRIPSPTTHNKLPFEIFYGQTPNYSSLHVFGYACFVSLPPNERTKLQPHTRLCCFLGYGVS